MLFVIAVRALAGVLMFAACLAAPSRAGAEPVGATYALGWTRMPRAESCIGGGALARAVERRLGHAAWVPAASADVLVEGYVDQRIDAPGWYARLVLTDAKGQVLGQREVSSAGTDCAALEQPLALMLALIIDPGLSLSSARQEPTARAPTPPVAASPSAEPPSAPPSPDVPRVGTDVGARFGLGLLPGIATGLSLAQTIVLGTWLGELGGTLWLPRGMASQGARSATFSLVVLTARACPIALLGSMWSFRACAGAEGGALVGYGFGFDDSRSRTRPAIFLSASARVGLRVGGPVSLGLGLSGLVPLVRDEFLRIRSDGVDETLFQMSVVAGAADLTLGAQF